MGLRRLMREVKEFPKQGPLALHVPDESTVHRLKAMIFGPEDTAYAGGIFIFDVDVGSEYPLKPPSMLLVTTNAGRTRFNPNLYARGKVCVTILGTFGGRDKWSPAMRLDGVLTSVQSLMTADPFHNEPGFEKCQHGKPLEGALRTAPKSDCDWYTAKITHEVIRVAALHQTVAILLAQAARSGGGGLVGAVRAMLPAAMGGSGGGGRGGGDVRVELAPLIAEMATTSTHVPELWHERCLRHFVASCPSMLATCDALSRHCDGRAFVVTRFEGPDNQCTGKFYFTQLRQWLVAAKRFAEAALSPVAETESPAVAGSPPAAQAPAATTCDDSGEPPLSRRRVESGTGAAAAPPAP